MVSTIRKRNFARRNRRAKTILFFVCLLCVRCHIGFFAGCPFVCHLVYHFSHANAFHFIVNMMVLWNIRNNIRPLPSLLLATAASFLPMYVSSPTMGMSAFLFSSFGIMWGLTGRWRDGSKKVLPFVLLTMIMPGINGLLHLYSFALGYAYGYALYKWRRPPVTG